MKEIENQDQLAGEMIHIRKKENGWKVFMTCGIPFEPMTSSNGATLADALSGLANKIRNVPIGSASAANKVVKPEPSPLVTETDLSVGERCAEKIVRNSSGLFTASQMPYLAEIINREVNKRE